MDELQKQFKSDGSSVFLEEPDMTTNDSYVALLEKRASADGYGPHESVPSEYNNGADVSTSEHEANKEDHRAYLHSIFSQAGAVQSNQSAELKKLFPNMPKDTIVSNPLIKVGRNTFFAALHGYDGTMKVASSIHREIAFKAFCDELEKIAAARG
jgi:hypothetical protein